MSLTGEAKIVQIHPTRRCNLRCRHCYSASGPDVHDALEPSLLSIALVDIRSEGYSIVSLSGGEPTLYDGLLELLRAAKLVGLRTTMTSNGMLLTKDRLEPLREHLDLLAISLDGRPESHNRMRAHDRAFEILDKRLEAIRESGIHFGFIFTLTQYNLDELDWVARYASDQGASLLQIHPLESVGRATDQLADATPDGIEASVAFLEAARLQEAVGDALRIQVDLSHRTSLRQRPDKVYADKAWTADVPLASLISPLVIETDGTVVPLQYGFSRDYALGNLHDARLAVLAERWKATTLPNFRDLCRRVHTESTHDAQARPFFNWYDKIRDAATREVLV